MSVSSEKATGCRPDGKVEVEENGEVTKVETSNVAGFVVDTQPDLRVSRVLPWLLLGRCSSCCMVFLSVFLLQSGCRRRPCPPSKGGGHPCSQRGDRG